MSEFVHTETRDHIATITISRPEKLNALDPGIVAGLIASVELLSEAALLGEEPPRAAILTGAGKAFVAGADIAAMASMTTTQAKRFADAGHQLGALLESAPFPIIAAVNGFALGGGCELALACDFIYASEKAKFGQPEVKLGVIPGFGGTQRLARRVGMARARELCFTGEIIGAAEALAMGLCNAVFPAEQLLEKARETASKIAAQGPLAIAAAKRVLLRGEDVALAAACELEAQTFAQLFGTTDQREGMAAFLEKRAAAFAGK